MVLVTGGTGFTGSWLICHLLQSGVAVRGLRRKTSDMGQFEMIYEYFFADKKQPNASLLEWVEGDILDIFSLEDAMTGCDTVYHTAALVSFYHKDIDLLENINHMGTRNVVDTMLYLNIKKLGYISSTAALGQSENNEPVSEITPWKERKTLSNYARSKHKAELEVWRGIEEGLDAAIVNPGVICGFGDWHHGSCGTFKKVYEGLKFYSWGVNGFVDVRDVCRAIIDLIDAGIYRQRFLLVSENLSYHDYFNYMTDAFQKKEIPFAISKSLGIFISKMIYLVEKIGFKNFFITSEIAKAAVTDSRFKSDKIASFIPFNFHTIKDAVNYASIGYKNNLSKLIK